jgi:para-aminobenzoate synthetase
VRILLIDNYDSYTYNLAHQIVRETGVVPTVVRNDAITYADVLALAPDAIVLSPGPGRPGVARDLGVSSDIVRHFSGPILGVCLGHQAIAWANGVPITRADPPMHGLVQDLIHDGTGLFAGLPSPTPVVRYHSLRIDHSLPPTLRATAWDTAGVIMALEHVSKPHVGVQFHPESVSTRDGDAMIANFFARVVKAPRETSRHALRPSAPGPATVDAPPKPDVPLRLHARSISIPASAEALFEQHLRGRWCAFWLDSSGTQGANPSRFSILGACDGPNGGRWLAHGGSEVRWQTVAGTIEQAAHPLVEALSSRTIESPDLPFPFRGGWVGWVAYEALAPVASNDRSNVSTPTVSLGLCERFFVLDHQEGVTWAVAIDDDPARAETDLDAMVACVAALPADDAIEELPSPQPGALHPERERHEYLDDIGRCVEKILDGESYEICLTQRLRGARLRDPFDAYRRLRTLNPAPYGAYLEHHDIQVLSSSPEMFLSGDASGHMIARPIKGTIARTSGPEDAERAQSLLSSEKDRAENLMIVDLLRHDLGRVAEWDTVRVPGLMEIETFATVHQMVSTITARRSPSRSASEAILACFPPGSMTGAPKLRTMEIIDELETSPRGIYSGALGWMSLDGAMDLAVVIRTAVNTPNGLEVGVGGALTALSDPESEWAEAMTKGEAIAQALYGQPIARR